MIRSAGALAALLVLVLTGCVTTPKKPAAPPQPAPIDALATGIKAGPSVDMLNLTDEGAARALSAFRLSCPALLRRTDSSRLTHAQDWQAACTAAAAATHAVDFFRAQFEAVQVGTGSAFATGYYEPEIQGSHTPVAGGMPVYALPPDLIEMTLLQCPADYPAKTPPAEPTCKRVTKRGRDEGGTLVPYYDRAAIEDGALAGRELELAYAVDPIHFFTLQIQGSGRLRFPDGTVMRLAYAGQNGQPYTPIGRVMRERGIFQPGQATMQGIDAWLHANPEPGRAIMRENKSWIFFKELRGPGPLGALNIPVTGNVSVAADPHFVPLGAPVLLRDMDRAEANGLWIAQDTGGAIKGANRVDTFWGAGEDATRIAGGMASRGQALLLLPKGVLARLNHASPHR